MEKTSECIKVGIRSRPLNSKEGPEEIVQINEDRKEIILKHLDTSKPPILFTYDFVYCKESSQERIYEDCARPVIDFLMKGFNCTIFAYGQTGTGKTFTMEGKEGSESQIGIIPRSFRQIFSTIKEAGEDQEYLVRCSMLEIYNEDVRDSFKTDEAAKKERLEVHEDPKAGFYVKGLSIETVKNVEELQKRLNFGKSTRRVRATEMNDYSSRSHSILSIIIESSQKTEDPEHTCFKIGKLNLVDLAGSEKQKQTKTTDEALKEGININLSLTTLGNVINLLVKSSQHIPYRNSKLTKLLADSLGGNSKTLMIANIGPASSNYAETLQTLKYANRAKMIKNKPKINEDSKDALLRQKQDELKILKLQIQQLTINNSQLVRDLKDLNVDANKIEDGKRIGKENQIIEEHLRKLTTIEIEGKTILKEKAELNKKLVNTQDKLKLEEHEKNKLIEKYNSMCQDIITKHDYSEDLETAKKELTKLNNDQTEKKNFLKTKKMLDEKKQEVDQIDAKSKQIQEQINQNNQNINLSKEQISFYKQNKLVIGQSLTKKIETLNSTINDNKEKLKKQSFFINLIVPQAFQDFIKAHENKDELIQKPFPMSQLRKPLSKTNYNIHSSYKNPYIKEIMSKQKKIEYPTDAEIYDDGILNRN